MKLHPAGFSQQRVLCSQTQSRKVVPSCPSQLKGPIRSHRMVRSAVALDGPGTATESNPDKQPAVQLIAQDGDLLSNLDDKVQVAVAQPSYTVRILYRSRGTPLQDASDIWAHMGHSGWQYKLDVKLERQSEDPQAWQGSYLIPIKQLSASWHLETQMVFKGLVGGHERWDNKGGSNWTVAVEVAPGVGLVQALNPTYASTRELTSSLLLRLEALVAARLLTPEQGSVLRVLAWQHDMGLIKAYQEIRNNKDERQVAGVLAGRCSWLRPPGLNVVHIASEMAPVAKVGGLADVTASLAKAHQASGLLTEIILPKYDCIKYDDVKELKKMATLHVPWGPDPNRTIETYVWSGLVDGLPVYFIEPNCSERYFWRGKFYGEPDDGARFSFFSRAALEFLAQRQHEAPDIIHCHDWQAAAVGPLLKETYRASGLARTRAVLTIHNMAFQGHLNGAFLQHMGLTPRAAHVTSPDIMLDGNAPPPAPANNSGNPYGHMWLNLLKGAIVYADRITTVSPTYANEVLGEEGKGLQHMLQRHRHKLAGVLNGLDYETWNPATDPCLPAHFTSEDLSGKRACKAAFLRELGLPFDGVLPGSNGHDSSGNGNDSGSPWGPNGRPLIAIVSRLTQQKGLHLMKAGLKAAVAAGAQVVVLGTAPDPKDQAEWEALAKEVGAGGDARIVLRHDEAMSHRIFAASDMLLVPSMFEPCGLTQLIALRYGTVPVVRETGGLADTVRDVAKAMPEHEKNGFTFTAKDAPAVEHALQRAINAYRDGRTWWQQELMPRIMRQDFGWTQSASTYQRIYNEAMH